MLFIGVWLASCTIAIAKPHGSLSELDTVSKSRLKADVDTARLAMVSFCPPHGPSYHCACPPHVYARSL